MVKNSSSGDRSVIRTLVSVLSAVYSPSLPLKQAKIATNVGYNPDKFTAKSLASLFSVTDYSWKQQARYGKFLAISGYYIWVFYLMAVLWIIALSPLAGFLAILISPLLVIAVMYIFVSLGWSLKYRRVAKRSSKKG